MKLTIAQTNRLLRLIRYQDRYEINIQFWPGQISVFVEKDGVNLNSWGGDFNHAINSALNYLDRINKNSKLPFLGLESK